MTPERFRVRELEARERTAGAIQEIAAKVDRLLADVATLQALLPDHKTPAPAAPRQANGNR